MKKVVSILLVCMSLLFAIEIKTDVSIAALKYCTVCGSRAALPGKSKCSVCTSSECAHSFTYCSKAHCGKRYCKKCGYYHNPCGGGHVWSSVYYCIDGSSHAYECLVSGCPATTGSTSHNWSYECNGSFMGGSYDVNTQHLKICNNCRTGVSTGFRPASYEAHTGGTATCVSRKKCSVCQNYYGSYGNHSWTTCTLPHCGKNYCSICGSGHEPCGGDHNSSGYCSLTHCKKTYCTLCYTTLAAHQSSGTCGGGHVYTKECPQAHCSIKICSVGTCGVHQTTPCGGGHVFNEECSQTHCTIKICTVKLANGNKCGAHQTTPCGGGCSPGAWKANGAIHYQICIKGCTRQLTPHTANWGVPNESHVATCTLGCKLTQSHSASWGDWTKSGTEHKRRCTVTTVSGRCTAAQSHSPTWNAFTKIGDTGDSDATASHIRTCSTCKLTDIHKPAWSTYTSISDYKHQRTCTATDCALKHVENHNINRWDSISGDLVYHKIYCSKCSFTVGNGNVLALHKNTNPVDLYCDLCKAKLWNEIKSIPTLTNQDVTVTVNMFDSKKASYLQSQITDKFTKNGTKYVTFSIESGTNVTIPIKVDNINKTVKGRVDVPLEPTINKITAIFRPDYEGYRDHPKGYNKDIFVKIMDGATIIQDWVNAYGGISTDITENGIYTYLLKDSLGNTKTITVTVDCIISGRATVTTTFDAMENGYVFANVMVRANEKWKLADVISNSVKVKTYLIGGGASSGKTTGVMKLDVMDEYGNRPVEYTNGTYIPAGIYYIKLGIGGNGVFTLPANKSTATYVVNLENVYLNNGAMNLTGKNRLYVNVQALKDLT